MESKFYAVLTTPIWAEIRECKVKPRLRKSVRYVMAEEEYVKTVRTKRLDDWGMPIYENKILRRKVRHPLTNSNYIGGSVICPISIAEFNKIARRHLLNERLTTFNPVVELSKKMQEKFASKEWRLDNLKTSVEL